MREDHLEFLAGSDTTSDPDGATDENGSSDAPEKDPSQLERFGDKALDLSKKLSNVGVSGLGPWKGAAQIADEHLAKHGDVEKAIQRLVATHARLATTTGFLTGLGGLITLPVALPADLTALWLTQSRLAGAIAHLRGYDVSSDEVRSVVLMSLVGSSVAETLSQAGVQIGTKSAISAISKVPGRVLIRINQMVGFRLITKAGTKGVVNLTKLAPVVGGFVGGGVNLTSTLAVGAWAKKNFPASAVSMESAPMGSDDHGIEIS